MLRRASLRTIRMFIALLAISSSVCHALTLRIPDTDDAHANYIQGLLQRALAETPQAIQMERQKGDFFISVERLLSSAETGEIDLIWTATNREVEKRLIPIRIPLYMGLFGYRVMIVERQNQDLFANVTTLEQAKRYRYGQGRGWTDSKILMANGLTVEQASKWPSLFYMTDGGRFHAFPRGVHEPWGELPQFEHLNLTVDQHLLMVYRMPFYLFVNPSKPELAEALTEALEQSVASGTFQSYFLQSDMLQNVLTNAKLAKRHRIYLDNPELPEKTPIHRKELWLESLGIFSTASQSKPLLTQQE